MKLFNAFIATSAIVLAFWSIAVFQPRAATKEITTATVKTQSHPETATTPTKTAPKSSSFGPIDIVGVTKNIDLQNISDVWIDFHSNSALHDQLNDYPDKVYVYYRDFSNDYQSATVSIGYSTEVLNKVTPKTHIAKGAIKQLLSKGSYSNTELANVWQQIDYRQTPKAVVEIHYLNKKGDTTNSEVLIRLAQ